MSARPSVDGRPSRLWRLLDRRGRDPRAIPVLGAVSIGDFFLPALPTQISVLALGWLQPRRAPWIALTFATAAALGAALLTVFVLQVGDYARQFGAETVRPEWADLQAAVGRYGAWAVFALSIFPTPPRLATAATLLSGAPPAGVIAAVFAGKLLWFGTVLTLLVRAPQLLVRVPVAGPRIRAALVRYGWKPEG